LINCYYHSHKPLLLTAPLPTIGGLLNISDLLSKMPCMVVFSTPRLFGRGLIILAMEQYEQFYGLHHQGKSFIIANAWNAKSAQIIEQCGFEAVATSSGAIAESLGYKDGEQIPFAEMLYMVKRIKAVTTIPLSVDMERGYTNELDILNTHLQQLIDAGVVGINLEDAQGEQLYLQKLSGIKNFLKKTGQRLFINARTDAFLQKLDLPLETVLRRAKLYKDAGADGLFVTAVPDTNILQQLSKEVALPLNVVSTPNLGPTGELASYGVKRISMAVQLYKKAYSQVENLAKNIREGQSFSPLFS